MTPTTERQQQKGPGKMTPKQARFLELIREMVRRDTVSPTLAELAAARGVTKATAAAYVRRLKASGHLMQTKGKFRTIRPVQDAGAGQQPVPGKPVKENSHDRTSRRSRHKRSGQ